MISEQDFQELIHEILYKSENDVFKDGFPFEAISKLDKPDTDRLINILKENIPTYNWRIYATICAVAPSKKMELDITNQILNVKNSNNDLLKIYYATALWRLYKNPNAIKMLKAMIISDPTDHQAIKALGFFDDIETMRLLVSLLNSADNMTRVFATHAILKRVGVTVDPKGLPHPWTTNIISNNSNKSQMAKSEIIEYLKSKNLYF